MFDESVWDAQPTDPPGVKPRLVGRLQHRTAKPARQTPLFHRQDKTTLLYRSEDRVRIRRFDELGVYYTDREGFFL